MTNCPYFEECGGCSSQHIPYELQLENKKKIVAYKSKTDLTKVKVFSDNPFNYRNRMDFVFHEQGLGFREKGKWWKIIDVKNCPIAEEKINELLSEIREEFKNIDSFDLKKHTGTYRYAVIRTASDSCITFILNPSSPKLSIAIEKIKEYSNKTKADNIIIAYVDPKTDQSTSTDYFVVKGKDELTENYLGKTFSYSAQGFFQNNHKMAEKMHEYVNNILKEYNIKHEINEYEVKEYEKEHEIKYQLSDYYLLDLYGGVGSFGIINTALFKKTISIESFEGCTISAKKNIEINKEKNMEAICLDAAQLKKIDLPEKLFVITDPPRSGMNEKTIEQIKKLKPKVIIYISCNPDQMGKDLPKFKAYSVKSVALFDLFPQTSHMEAVTELIIKENKKEE
jgi:23S rRNA (uracil-5-)-methyltransferase RumA